MGADPDKSLSDEATFAIAAKRRSTAEMSLGDQQTLVGGDRSGQDTVIDDIEIVDLESRYKVEGTLGQGGMGAVLLATDTRLDRKVAIKRILGEAAGNRMAVQRFLTEAKAIAALNHPNIVQIYDYGRAKDGPFLIMEYVDGGSLLDRCRESALPLDEAIDLACQLCDGLAKAHDLKIIHRDIKPANVLLTRDGVPKLTDFGLAKAQASDHGQTMTGAVLGTPDFMPPEQRRDAAEVDHRSDLWSLGATVYQMATGRSPKIIRFDLLPTDLTKVLGKALEDAKDARYQSARELRDALKTGLRTAAVVEELIEGACPACGVKNESSRRFCRGCGESLEAECLSCTKAMPMWEEICGSCGAKQAPLVAERRESMAARQAEAEGLLGDFEFDRAAAIAAELRDEPHRRLRYLTGWAGTFLGEVEKSRADQTRHAAEAMAEAAKHEAAYDYLSAVFTLESIPQSLRIGTLPGASESVATALERVKSRQKEASGLESKVKSRLASKNLDDLLPTVERLLELQPDRPDVQKLRTQLRDRNEKLTAVGAAAFREAQALLDSHDYEGAIAALTPLKGVARNIEVEALQERATGLLTRTRDLIQRIREAVAAKQFEGLLGTVENYLKLKPADGEIQTLRQSLVEREKKVLDEITKRLEKARNLEQACRFEEAAKLLSGIPESRRSGEAIAILTRSSRLASLRKAALAELRNAKDGSFGDWIDASQSYRTALAETQVADAEFESLFSKASLAWNDVTQTRRYLYLGGMAAVGLVAAFAIVAGGFWIRSTIRAASLSNAIAQGRWDDVLLCDPNNVDGLVGRARGKLTASPPDIDGAFADLDVAKNAGDAVPISAARADAHAIRALALAQGEQLDDAARDLAEARHGGASEAFLNAAQSEIVSRWVARAQKSGWNGHIPRLQKTVADTLVAGADPQHVITACVEYVKEWQRLWESQAALRVWPAELGPGFLDAVKALQPGDRLDRPNLIGYQRRVPRFARALAARMGVPERMETNPAANRPGDEGQPQGPRPVATWSPEDQQRLAKGFSWGRPPTTEQVLLAQQELWVYGLFCDIIRDFNKKATGPHDTPIPMVRKLAVGSAVVDSTPDSLERGNASEEGTPSSHPRFTQSSELDSQTTNTLFIDTVPPLPHSEEGAEALGLNMTQAIPFDLCVDIDRSEVDGFLKLLATHSIPIGVQQVRTIPASEIRETSNDALDGAAASRNPQSAASTGPNNLVAESNRSSLSEQGEKNKDAGRDGVILKLRGNVKLARPPNVTSFAPNEIPTAAMSPVRVNQESGRPSR